MSNNRWSAWVVSSRSDSWPTRVGELLPGELSAAALSIDNDPSTRHMIDATGFLSVERLEVLLDGLANIGAEPWLVGFWDGWSGIGEAIRRSFGHRSFPLVLPLRNHLATIATLDEVRRFSRLDRPYLGPGVLAPVNRAALVLSDVDSPTTYAGFANVEMRDHVAAVFARHAMTGVARCDGDTTLATGVL